MSETQTKTVETYMNDPIGFFDESVTEMHCIPREKLESLQRDAMTLRFADHRENFEMRRARDSRRVRRASPSSREGSGEAYKPVAAGAATAVWAASAPELGGVGGIYLAHCGVAPPIEDGWPGYASHAVDRDAALRLWKVSEAANG
jgi:hypothetical protein